MRSKINIKYNGMRCVPQGTLTDYLKGNLSGVERNAVERHLLDCPMCAAALQGLSLLEDSDEISSIVKSLNSRIDERLAPRKSFKILTPLRIAASVTILLAVSGLIYFTSTLNTPSNTLSEYFSLSAEPEHSDLLVEMELEDSLSMQTEVDVAEKAIPVTQQEVVMPKSVQRKKTMAAGAPPPTRVAAMSSISKIIVVEDDVEIDDDIDLFDMEFYEDVVVKIVNEEEEIEEEQIFMMVEDMPSFKGGDIGKFKEYINENLNYPEIAAENGIQGRVILSFVVELTGKVSSVKVLRGVDPNLDKEAVRVIEASPLWNPGKQRGKPVRVSFNVPVIFVLQ